MTLYHPRALADKLEGLVPELQRWSHRASMALDNAHIQQKRIEDRQIQTGHSAQVYEQQLVADQEAVQNGRELLQVCGSNCLEALAQAQQTASAARSILHETQTIYNRTQQALHNAQEILVQAEQALELATAKVGKHKEEFATANTGRVQDNKRTANHGLSLAKKAQSQASRTARAASARVANCTKALTFVSQALQLARVLDQQAQAGLKASEDSTEFIRAAERALDLGQRELGQEEAIVKATAEAMQYASLITEEASVQVVVAHAHEQPAQQHTTDTLRILQIKISLLMVMNRPELENFADPMMAVLQSATVTDKGEQQQALEAKLERLRTKLEKIYGFKPEQWSKLKLAERADVLQNVHNALAATYRFKPIPVELALLPQKIAGAFSEKIGCIAINIFLVASDDYIETLGTIIHESRHAYQWHMIQRFQGSRLFLSETDCALAQEWRDNFDDYKSAAQYGSRAYLKQPVESDAFGFEAAAIKFLLGA